MGRWLFVGHYLPFPKVGVKKWMGWLSTHCLAGVHDGDYSDRCECLCHKYIGELPEWFKRIK